MTPAKPNTNSLQSPRTINRRDLLRTGTAVAAAAGALAGVAVPAVHAADDSTIRLALVGVGGRGGGAAGQAMSVSNANTQLVAMVDVFQDRLDRGAKTFAKYGNRFNVAKDNQFLGFDGYKHAMDLLRPGDVVILTTPPAFRWVHFTYAISKGLNVFMEKPVCVDGPSGRRMLKLYEEAKAKNLKVGVGLMVRHAPSRIELKRRLDSGEIGDIIAMRGYRMGGAAAKAYAKRDPAFSETLFQVKNFHSFLWASGGVYSDYYIHQIDELSWMKGAWPVKAQALGGRHYRGQAVDQNLDVYAVEYTYPDGTKLFYDGRQMEGTHMEFASYIHGTKGGAIVSTNAHHPGRCRTFKDQTFSPESMTWEYPLAKERQEDPYQVEWNDLVDAIKNDKPYNEVKRGVEASLVTAMGRLAAHTGQIWTYEQMLNHEHEFAPNVDKLTAEGPAPLTLDKDGKYPVPEPGYKTKREY